MTALRLFGCIHTNRQSVVESDLEAFADGVDAYAIENPVFDSVRQMLATVAAVPFLAIGLNTMGALVQMPLFLVGHRDIVQTELRAVNAVAADRPIHSVDRSPLALVADRGWPWLVGNWAALGGLVYLAPVSTLALVGIGLLGMAAQTVRRHGYRYSGIALALATIGLSYGLLVVGYIELAVLAVLLLLSVVVVWATIGARNAVMLDEVAELATAHGYEDVCLLTGRKHIDGMLDIAPSRELTVTAAFRQRWRRSGYRVGPEGDSVATESDSATETPGRSDRLFRRRLVAAVVDWIPVLAGLSVAVIALGAVYVWLQPFAAPERAEWALAAAIAVSTFAVPVGYHTLCEGLWDRTLGKYLAGIRVQQLDGTSVPMGTAFVRALGGVFDFLPVGYLVGAVVAALDDDGRRLGDIMAGTVVVRDGDEPDAGAGADD